MMAKTLESVYEDPFDLGGGGAVLTRGTQEAMLVSNPSLLPYGGKFFRWLGSKTVFGTAKETTDLISKLASGEDVTQSEDSESSEGGIIDTILGAPLHLYTSQSFSFITNNGGFSVFNTTEPDLKFWKMGDPIEGTGIPMLVLKTEVYSGAVLSLASRTPWEWMSVGVSAKYILKNEGTTRISLADTDASKVQKAFQESVSPSQGWSGTGTDASMLIFLQGRHVDFRLTSVVKNVGGMTLKSISGEETLPQITNIGLGLTLHTSSDAIHFSLDYRDLDNVNKQELFKRVYMGSKFLLTNILGVSAGYYHGNPSYGLQLDLYFLRIALSQFTKEYGNNPGVDSRNIILFSLSAGTTL